MQVHRGFHDKNAVYKAEQVLACVSHCFAAAFARLEYGDGSPAFPRLQPALVLADLQLTLIGSMESECLT